MHPSLPPNAPVGHSPPATTQVTALSGVCDEGACVSVCLFNTVGCLSDASRRLLSLSYSFLTPTGVAGCQQAKVITGEDCDDLRYISDVVGAQNGKSPEVVSKSAAVLIRHGFEKESRLLAGRQSTLIICLCYVVRTVSFDSHLVASTTAH